jgi:hypothetical protein
MSSEYWGPPRHDLPLVHAPPNPTDAWPAAPILGGGWEQPVGSGTPAHGSGVASIARSDAAATPHTSRGGTLAPNRWEIAWPS